MDFWSTEPPIVRNVLSEDMKAALRELKDQFLREDVELHPCYTTDDLSDLMNIITAATSGEKH